ncbi:(Fe-S)-binding protein [Enterovibrio makurazakiensis]|uniref:(Fe-S)-binding protein n=1 Tax=Enterovibrio gelatinilyticus TaxID=2899819 RepID=A0ABT5R539_9GAMM|nr:(Fe-S)-binding protein [Enterovibrio sp. ZSDZ42]MDD1795395.1 (Fe-S)-binding protein [Enterovibrio sp. ZSDZ42]
MTNKVFMPGCSLPSYSPEGVAAMAAHLKNVFPEMGAVQKCCGKPTAAIGQADKFKERYGQLQADFDMLQAEEVIVACQSCYGMIKKSGGKQKPLSLWKLLPTIGLPKELVGKAKDSDVVFTIHDSCSTRYEKELQDGIRWIMTELGYKIVEPEYTRENTRCCGFGGMVVPANPDIANRVVQRRVDEFQSDHVVVYCAACRASMMGVGQNAWHILDLMFGPVVMKDSPAPVNVLANPMKAWFNRYKSRSALIKCVSL